MHSTCFGRVPRQTSPGIAPDGGLVPPSAPVAPPRLPGSHSALAEPSRSMLGCPTIAAVRFEFPIPNSARSLRARSRYLQSSGGSLVPMGGAHGFPRAADSRTIADGPGACQTPGAVMRGAGPARPPARRRWTQLPAGCRRSCDAGGPSADIPTGLPHRQVRWIPRAMLLAQASQTTET